MNSPRISALVPVYKVEAYLQRCIDSVLAQDFTDWEMILVDDGSPDRCPEICDEAAKKDARIRVVHKENGGLPSARLAGFERAKGTYLVFLDSDDWLLEGALTILYDEITKGDYDIVRTCPLRANDAGRHWKESYEMDEGEILDNETYVLCLLHNKIAPYLHSAIFKRTLFTAHVFQKVIDGGITIGEDWVTNMLISPYVQRFKAIEVSPYVYFCNSSSMMSTYILSPQYNMLVDLVLKDFYNNSSARIQQASQIKRIVGMITANFIYEIPYHGYWYTQVRAFLSEVNNYEEVKKLVPSQYMRFIKNRYLFFIYARLYAFSKFVLKQKMRRRIVLPQK